MELGQLHVACEMMRRYEGREPAEILPSALPTPLTMEPNKQYVRNVLASQVDLTFLGTEPVAETHRRFEEYQNAVLADGSPSEEVIDMNVARNGTDYRIEAELSPVERLRRENYANTRRRG